MAVGGFRDRVVGRKEFGPQRQFIGLQMTGTDKLYDALDKLGMRAPKSLAGALYREANYLMTDAKRETPVDQGPLRASGHVAEPVIDGTRIEVVLGFGGPAGSGNHNGQTNDKDVGYAVYVHEDLNAKHDDGKAKYLEDPALARAKGMEDRLARDVRRDIEDLGR